MSGRSAKTYFQLVVWTLMSWVMGALVLHGMQQYTDSLNLLFEYWYLGVASIIFISYYWLKMKPEVIG